MYVRRNIRWRLIALFSWPYIIGFTLWSLIVCLLYRRIIYEGIDISIPYEPMGTIGVAVALYVGFKNNQSYDRNWEGRIIWGGIVNVSRSWANAVLTFVTPEVEQTKITPDELREIHKTLIYRHVAWTTALRHQLRRKLAFSLDIPGAMARYHRAPNEKRLDDQVHVFLPKSEADHVLDCANAASQIVRQQGEQLRQLRVEKQLLSEFTLISMTELLTEMYTLQGQCERIKNTPFPRQYAYFSKLFTYIFVLLLPMGIVGKFGPQSPYAVWATIPFSVLVSWIFITMELVGDSSEDPFENFINDVPMSALCRTIEIDLRQMLGETDVPEPLTARDDILL